MAYEDDKKRKCFSFIWKVENADYWWKGEYIRSPEFIVEEIGETNWKLNLFFSLNDRHNPTQLFLQRQTDDGENVEFDCELAFLSPDGTILHAFYKKNSMTEEDEVVGSYNFPPRNDVFFARRSVFLSQDTLTVRCRIWKSAGKMSKDVQCFARTRIPVEKRSFLWDIEDVNSLESNHILTYEIKSISSGERLMTLELCLSGGIICEETIRLKIISNCKNMKMSTLQLSIIDAFKNTVKCFQGEFWVGNPSDIQDFNLFHTKRELMEKKNVYLPNDVLSLLCECPFAFGNVVEELKFASSKSLAIENLEYDNSCLGKANELSVPKGILINDLKSMLINSSFSDVKLKTRSKTYPAHKLILGFRSPVFKAMFSNNMKENISDCVDIDDLSDETVLRMLRYIYCANVEELEWGRASELYEAADKYQVLNLKDICSSFLKSNLCPNNACEALVLADLHQDEDLKRFVQDFILRHGEDIINSEEWEKLMETNLKLVAETMRLKFKVLVK